MYQRGFTIIEVLLFLSISSLMFVVLMAGVSTNINQQRYKDSVSALSATLQQQYSEVVHTRNDRDEQWKCTSSEVEQSFADTEPRGTSRCVILGRYIRALDNGTRLDIGTIIGTEPAPGAVAVHGDGSVLRAYQPKFSSFEQINYTPEWGVVLRDPDRTPADFTVLMLRSPASGLVRSFVVRDASTSSAIDAINEEAARQKVTICVDGEGWSFGPEQAIVLDASTAGANAIAVKGEADEC